MRVIVINRNKLGVTIVIIGLMLILFGFYRNFDKSIKQTVLMQNNISYLVEYRELDNKLTYKLPAEWTTKVQKFEGPEILYHNDFQSRDAKIHGFVQVWNLEEDLQIFLQKSKDAAFKQNQYKDYKIVPIKLNNKEGYELIYTTFNIEDNVSYKGDEYFIRTGNGFLRISFFVRDKNYKENMATLFRTIAETINFYL